MVIDSSAVVAVLLNENARVALVSEISRRRTRCISVANWLEVALVLDKRTPGRSQILMERFARDADIQFIAVTLAQVNIAIGAFERFGKGRHAAGLNYGDCFAYALAKERGEPLLFVGNDFRQTDIEAALPPA